MKAEKTHQGLLQGVEGFSSDQLKSVKTREPQSPTAQIQVQGRTAVIKPTYFGSRQYTLKGLK